MNVDKRTYDKIGLVDDVNSICSCVYAQNNICQQNWPSIFASLKNSVFIFCVSPSCNGFYHIFNTVYSRVYKFYLIRLKSYRRKNLKNNITFHSQICTIVLFILVHFWLVISY
jgi:hypothetical protein